MSPVILSLPLALVSITPVMTVVAAVLFFMLTPLKAQEIGASRAHAWNFRVQPDYSADGVPARGNTCAIIYTMKDTGKTVPCLTSPVIPCVDKIVPTPPEQVEPGESPYGTMTFKPYRVPYNFKASAYRLLPDGSPLPR
ncbi:MAG TPA: hypothetical protein VFE60_24785 [Roseiarcus sp.]|jgi:hypothetical protein|nr:hypothetical protein [Roseiarcus sp.]